MGCAPTLSYCTRCGAPGAAAWRTTYKWWQRLLRRPGRTEGPLCSQCAGWGPTVVTWNGMLHGSTYTFNRGSQ